MILTNDEKFVEWPRPMIYDGRHKDRLYKDDEFECIGWYMYMTPEDAHERTKNISLTKNPKLE